MNSASSFLKAVEGRRSYYALTARSPVSDERIVEILQTAVRHAPSAFNSQSARVMLLRGENHAALWEIVAGVLAERVPPESFGRTKEKLDTFAAAYATLLFFEDQRTIETLQADFPAYADNFPRWSEQASGMLQFIVWAALEAEGFGANLQHYNPIIDERVRQRFDVPQEWRLISQMPFGMPAAQPDEKEFLPIEARLMLR